MYLKEIINKIEVPLDNVFDMDYPEWGADDRGFLQYKTIKNTNLITTYGFNNEFTNFELYIESEDEIEDFEQSWQKNLLYEVCRTIPEIEDFEELIEETHFFVIQLHMEGAPYEWSLDNPNGNIGIFIGLKNELINNKDFKNISIKLMRPAELEYILNNGEASKEKLSKLYYEEEIPTNSSMSRKSVL